MPNDVTKELLSHLGLALTIAVLGSFAVVAFLGKLSIERFFRSLEEKVKRDDLRELEYLRARLGLLQQDQSARIAQMQAEHSIKFAALHEKRLQHLGELYERLAEISADTKELYRFIDEKSDYKCEDRGAKLEQKSYAAREYFQNYKIYFPKSIRDRVRDLIDESVHWAQQFQARNELDGTRTYKEMASLGPSLKAIEKDVDAIMADIDDDVDKLLGVERQ